MSLWRRCTGCVCYGIANNPAISKILGVCPLIAVSDTVLKALTLSVLLGVVMLLSSGITSVFRTCVNWRLKPMHHAVVAAFSTAVVVSAASIQHFELIAALGIYPSLIASNCLVLSVMREIAERNNLLCTVAHTVRDAAYIGAWFCLFGLLREYAAYGAVFTDLPLLVGVYFNEATISAGFIPLLKSGPGALLALALCLAATNAVTRRGGEPELASGVTLFDGRPAAHHIALNKPPR